MARDTKQIIRDIKLSQLLSQEPTGESKKNY